MKNILRLFVLLLTILGISSINAEGLYDNKCPSSDLIDLYSIASHVALDFEYDEKNDNFILIVENLNPYISISFNAQEFKYSSKGTKIGGLKEGERIKLEVIASEYSECYKTSVRTITYVLPYINRYLETEECANHPETQICNTKFTDYELTYSLFKKMVEKNVKDNNQEKKEEAEEEHHWYDIYLEYLDKYGMQVGLFLIGAVATIIIGHGTLVRAKSKI